MIARKNSAPHGREAAEKILSEYYGKSAPEKVIPLIGFDEKLKRRSEILELRDKLDQEKKQIEQEVKLFMEDAEKADSNKYSITWKSDRKSTRLNSSHVSISYAVFCLKKKKQQK